MKFIRLILTAGLFTALTCMATAQDNDITFPAKELQQVALQYSGNTIHWHFVLNLAEHDVSTNTFTLSSSDVLQLQNFSPIAVQVGEQKERVGGLISSGATIFASEQFQTVEDIISNYTQAVKNGELDQAFDFGTSLEAAVDELENTLMENRIVDVQAQLSRKTGEVDKRRGILGSWLEALLGDLFKEADGIRTHNRSYATLSFTDGSNIQVNPNTVAVIRKSRIDKLNKVSDTEITLEDGGLLAKLSASGKEKSKYILNAGSSQSELKTQNFYAETEGDERVRLTNYDGQAIVNASDVSITIQKNEGTIVEEGKAPLAPVKLLPAPPLAWASADTLVNEPDIIFAFEEVEGAQNYQVQYSTSPNFDKDVVNVTTTQTAVNIEDLRMGITYARVQAVDDLGLRGPYSTSVRIIRTIDNKPPPIFIDDLRNNMLFATDDRIEISGVTEPEATLKAGQDKIKVLPSGRFKHTYTGLKGEDEIKFTSTDLSDNTTEHTITLVRLTQESLFDINVRGASRPDPIVLKEGTVTFSGKAYPGLEVSISNGNLTRSVKTDSRGRWGITMQPVPGTITFGFKNAYSGIAYFTESYTIENQQ